MNKVCRTAIESVDVGTMKAANWIDSNSKPLFILLAITFLVYGAAAFAGTSGGEFQGIYEQVKDWTSGYLGKAIALFAFLLGLGIGCLLYTSDAADVYSV